MTVSELLDKLKDCAPGAEVVFKGLFDDNDGYPACTLVESNGEQVELS